MLLRGGAEQFIAETERSLHDAIMIVRRAKKNDSIVAGKTIEDFFLVFFGVVIAFANFILIRIWSSVLRVA